MTPQNAAFLKYLAVPLLIGTAIVIGSSIGHDLSPAGKAEHAATIARAEHDRSPAGMAEHAAALAKAQAQQVIVRTLQEKVPGTNETRGEHFQRKIDSAWEEICHDPRNHARC